MTLRHISNRIYGDDNRAAALHELMVSYPIPKITENSIGAVELATSSAQLRSSAPYLSNAPAETMSVPSSSRNLVSLKPTNGKVVHPNPAAH